MKRAGAEPEHGFGCGDLVRITRKHSPFNGKLCIVWRLYGTKGVDVLHILGDSYVVVPCLAADLSPVIQWPHREGEGRQ